ncbi:MAG: response regulator [Desulfobulbaceae bacterium]|nr:response regulator [Desulfobulbaceae bacterium]
MSDIILFVNNDPKILNTLEQLLQQESFQTIASSNGSNALERLKQGEQPAVILTDSLLLDMSASEFLRKVKALSPKTMRLMLLDATDSESALEAINSKVLCRYIVKPWNDIDLIDTVKKAVDHYKLIQENERLNDIVFLENEKLELLNKNLDYKIRERTQALDEAYQSNLALTEELRKKVKELEGRDRILNHLLTIHNLENSLHTILEVVCDVLDADWACIYLPDNEDNLQARATIGETTLRTDQSHLMNDVFASKTVHTALKEFATFAIIPILKSDQCLGVMEIFREESLFSPKEIKIMQQFMVHSAIAVSDAMIEPRKHLHEWDETLDDILLGLGRNDPH